MTPPTADGLLARLSLNQATTQHWSVREAIEGCRRASIPTIGLWRHHVAEIGTLETARLIKGSGMRVSSLCRGGAFPAASAAERRARIEDNFRAIDEAAEVGAPVVPLVCGAAPDVEITSARSMIEEGIAAILQHARERNVMLGVEPLHPMFAADRSAVVTIQEALDLLDRLDSPQLGMIVDVYHVWWDPNLYAQIARAAGRIVGFHLNDWQVPLGDPLHSRGMIGDGTIDLQRIMGAVNATGYLGPIEVEIFNHAIWDMQGDVVLGQIKERYSALCNRLADERSMLRP